MLSVRNISKFYEDGASVLEEVSFDLGPEETMAIVGPSGCGKTTLLYLMCGLISCSQGDVILDGVPVKGPTAEMSIILQDYGLLPWRSIMDNVALGLKVRNVPRSERRARAREQLAELGISDRDEAFPGELSGGEQQRVAIARAYVSWPKILLMDEPFSSLDALTREKLQATLLETWNRHMVPYVLVTHSLEEAAFLGRRILVMSSRPARVAACLDNPGFGDERYRDTQEYYSLLRELRATVEKVW